MKRYIKNIIPAAALALTFGMTSCTGDLDVEPIDPNLSLQYDIQGLFNKCYANIGLAGNGGANGDCDIDGLDGGTTGFVRQMWNSNELTTDEAICHWGDDGIQSFCYNTYDASHPMLNGYYARLTTGISYCNHYLEVASDYDATMTAEIRFIRALHYYMLMDAYGNIPFATTLTQPERMTRAEAYAWLETELLDLETSLSDAKAKKSSDANYGRVDKAAAWMLLSRLYLNAEVYTGTAQWQKAADYAQKVMNSTYKLNTQSVNGWSAYQMLFMGDNGETNAAYEGVFPILQDGLKTTSWGTSLYLIASTYDADMHSNPNDPIATNGTDQVWGGNKARPDLIKKFFPDGNAPQVNSYNMTEAAGDDRALFDGVGRESIDNTKGYLGDFKDGYAVAKFTNFKTDGSAGHDATFPDMDYFFFRVAEAYLTYAEATARINGGTAIA
ncbi:MAG: RagB/SusD family nutrient uptake outer membrane protein, partial [Prevotella sp.]|nr:RagB/SusD family nutrient uptake outer membrane protein [Prevotella sp.]